VYQIEKAGCGLPFVLAIIRKENAIPKQIIRFI